MSKTVYLLDTKGDFIAFGVGMFLLDNADNTVKVGVLAGKELAGWNLSEHATPQESKGARAAWIQAIIAAPDGSLLRWDAEKGYPVDELEDSYDAFAAYDEATLASIEQKFLKLLAKEEPDHPWLRNLRPDAALDTTQDSQSGPIATEPFPETPLRSEPVYGAGAASWPRKTFREVSVCDGPRSKEFVRR